MPIYIFKIGLVDDSRSDAAAAIAERLDLGQSDGRPRLHTVFSSAAAEASSKVKVAHSATVGGGIHTRFWLVILRERNVAMVTTQ